jgi:hypothetical protein
MNPTAASEPLTKEQKMNHVAKQEVYQGIASTAGVNAIAAPSDRTELERLCSGYERSADRFRDMITALESRLDRVTSSGQQGATATQSPAAPSGTIAALNQHDNDFDMLCSALDAQLCRLYKIL